MLVLRRFSLLWYHVGINREHDLERFATSELRSVFVADAIVQTNVLFLKIIIGNHTPVFLFISNMGRRERSIFIRTIERKTLTEWEGHNFGKRHVCHRSDRHSGRTVF